MVSSIDVAILLHYPTSGGDDLGLTSGSSQSHQSLLVPPDAHLRGVVIHSHSREISPSETSLNQATRRHASLTCVSAWNAFRGASGERIAAYILT